VKHIWGAELLCDKAMKLSSLGSTACRESRVITARPGRQQQLKFMVFPLPNSAYNLSLCRYSMVACGAYHTALVEEGGDLMDSARHVIGCHLTRETRIRDAFDDVASTVCQSLEEGGDLMTFGAGAKRYVESQDEVGEVRRCKLTPPNPS